VAHILRYVKKNRFDTQFFNFFYQYVHEFPTAVHADYMAPAFGMVAAVTAAAILAPVCKDGWIMSGAWAVVGTFLVTYIMSNVYFDGMLYESRAAKWQTQLQEAKNKFIM